MTTTISAAAAAISETRDRRLAALCVFAAWVALTVALATASSGVSVDPMTYAGGIGWAVGMFLNSLWRESSKGMRHAFTLASFRAGSYVAAVMASILVALILHPVLRTDGLEAMLLFGLGGFIMLMIGGWLWGRGRNG